MNESALGPQRLDQSIACAMRSSRHLRTHFCLLEALSQWTLTLLFCIALVGMVLAHEKAAFPPLKAHTTQLHGAQSNALSIDAPARADSAPAAPQPVAIPDSAAQGRESGAFWASQLADTAAVSMAAPARSTPADQPLKKKAPARKIKLIKHDFDLREQIIMAVGMMLFVLLMMNTSQALNPD